MENLTEKLLFPVPTTRYNAFSFPTELLWFPVHSSDYTSPDPEDYGPAILLESKSARYLIIYFHSNAEDIATTYKFAQRLRNTLESTILSVELPGYGICPGTPSQALCATLAKAAVRFVQDILKWPLEDVICMGRSLGTYMALEAATNAELAGVVLISPFASIRSTVSQHVGMLGNLVPNCFNNAELVKKVPSKLVIIHGSCDRLVPVAEAKQVFDNAANPHRLFIPHINHNTDLFRCPMTLICPMHESFPLPDYKFDRMLHVPSEAFDRRLGGVRFSLMNSPLRQPRGDLFPEYRQAHGRHKDALEFVSPPQPHGDIHGMEEAPTVDEDEYNYDDHDDCDDTTASGLRTPDLDLITPGIERGIDRFIADFPPHKDEYESMVELLPSSPLLISRFASMCN